MIQFEFDHTNFHLVLRDFAKKLGTTIENDTLYFPAEYGEGYMRALRLPNGLSVLLVDCSTDINMVFKRLKLETPHFILNFDEAYIRYKYAQIIENEKIDHIAPVYSGVYLNNTMFDITTLAYPGGRFKTLKIIFEARWMGRYLGIDKDDKVLLKYLALKSKRLTIEPMDGEYRKYIDELFAASPKDPVYYTIVENRVMLLMERFFTRMYEKMKHIRQVRMDRADIYKMMEVEAELTRDFSDDPPTIEQLSERFGVGASKLKRQFKQVYGYPIYEYFQKYRMERAKLLLLTGDYSVKEVGYKVGYQNLSNFARAFKNSYYYLPSEILRFHQKAV